MSTLQEILEDPAVEVIETTIENDRAAFEGRREAVREERNRAVGGVVRDDGAVLLVSAVGDDGSGGWRLPGTPVGGVEQFEPELRAAFADQFGVESLGVEPVRVHQQTAHHGGEAASLYYVICEVDLAGDPRALSPVPDDLLAEWFETPPEEAVNDGVLAALFGED